jgi:tripartite-type tricarboxylate transporter receptor subunit TctC
MKPGTITFATVGSGGSTRIFFELMKSAADVDIRYIPYKGAAPAITDILGGQVDGIAVDLSALLPFVKSGKLRALGITTEHRNPELPNLKTMIEQGMPELTAGNWFAVLGPPKMPAPIVATLHGALLKIVNSQDFKEKLLASGSDPMSSATPEALTQVIKSEYTRWGRVVKAANIQSE